MEPFVAHTGLVAALPRDDVDTDQIIPKQFLKRIERTGFGEALFWHWRRLPDGRLDPEFPLNRPEAAGATILITGRNFGCGSSREHAPWALLQYGFRAIVAPSFADIFYANCCQNGLLPVVLEGAEVEELVRCAGAGPYRLTVDLERQRVADGQGFDRPFAIDRYRRDMLLAGLDEIGATLRAEPRISAYERHRARAGLEAS
jgi:3-isopropylmalate/(R)-2-methylmalate dehydratase small subunit